MKLLRPILIVPGAIANTLPFEWVLWARALFFILVIEGALRKWILPFWSEPLYFLKDFVLIVTLLKYLHSGNISERARGGRIGIRDNAVHWLAVLCFAYGVLQCFNPHLGSPLIGLIGLRNYFLGLPLIYITQFMFDSRKSLYTFLSAFMATSFFVCLLCIVQYNSPADSTINIYAHEAALGESKTATDVEDKGPKQEVIAGLSDEEVSERVRSTGPFSYITGLTMYCGFCLIFLLPLYRYPLNKRNSQFTMTLLLFAALGCLLLSSFLSASRMPILLFGFYCIAAFTLHLLTRRLSISKGGILGAVTVAYLLLIPLYSYVEPWVERVQKAEDTGDRITTILPQMIAMTEHGGLFGYGIGRTFNGVDTLVRTFRLSTPTALPVAAEKTTSRLVLELGLIGTLLMFGLKLGIAYRLLLVFDRTRDTFLRELACSGFVYNLINLQYIPVSSMDGSIYFWFTASLAVLIPSLEQRELSQRAKRDGLPRHQRPMQQGKIRAPGNKPANNLGN